MVSARVPSHFNWPLPIGPILNGQSVKECREQADALLYRMSEKDCTLFNFYFLGAQCVESGVSCTDCY
jgi:hypothetical protein